MKLISTALREVEAKPTPTPRTIISMEDEFIALDDAGRLGNEIESNISEIDHGRALVSALEDLEFVVDGIDKPTPREAALIQIAGDAAVAGTDVDGSELTPTMEDNTIDKSKLRQKIDAIIRMIKDALKALITKFTKFIQRYSSVGGNIAHRIEELDEKLKKAKDSKASEKIKGFSFTAVEVAELDQGISRVIQSQSFYIRDAAAVGKAAAQGESKDRLDKKLAALKNAKSLSVDALDVEILFSGIPSNVKPEAGELRRAIIEHGAQIDKSLHNREGKEVAVPTVAELRKMVEAIKKLSNHAVNDKDANSLLGAMEVRSDFYTRFSEEITGILQNQKDLSVENIAVAQAVVDTLSTHSIQPYVRLLNMLVGSIYRAISFVNKALAIHAGGKPTNESYEVYSEEGIKDWVKDLFSAKVKSSDVVTVSNVVEQMETMVSDKRVKFDFDKSDVINFMFKNERAITNLPQEILKDLDSFKTFTEAMKQFNALFSKITKNTTEDEGRALAKSFKADVIKRLGNHNYLGNLETEFYNERYYGDSRPMVDDPHMLIGNSGLIDLFISVAIFAVSSSVRTKYVEKFEKEFQAGFDEDAFITATKKLAAEFKLFLAEIDTFVKYTTALKGHDSSAVRDLMRFGNDVGATGVYIVTHNGEFFDAVHNVSRGLSLN